MIFGTTVRLEASCVNLYFALCTVGRQWHTCVCDANIEYNYTYTYDLWHYCQTESRLCESLLRSLYCW